MNQGYVYLIVEVDQEGKEKYKIGVTKNDPEKRLLKLKTGNSNEMFIIKTYKSENYRRIEKWLHRRYKNQRTLSQNEFFYLNDSQALGFLNDCESIDRTIKSLKADNPFFK